MSDVEAVPYFVTKLGLLIDGADLQLLWLMSSSGAATATVQFSYAQFISFQLSSAYKVDQKSKLLYYGL